jgi:hypothetical protein
MDIKPGERIFDVGIQDQTVAVGLDVAARAEGPRRVLTTSWDDIPVDGTLEITLTPHSTLPPILCGLELVAQ